MADIKMVSMKIEPKAQHERNADTLSSPQPSYPHGLGLYLDDDSLAKLGLAKMPDVGKSVIVVGRADVSSASQHERDDGGGKKIRRSLSLQITDLGLGDPEPAPKDAETVLYQEQT